MSLVYLMIQKINHGLKIMNKSNNICLVDGYDNLEKTELGYAGAFSDQENKVKNSLK